MCRTWIMNLCVVVALSAAEAFVPDLGQASKIGSASTWARKLSSSTAKVDFVETQPIQGMKPGTSGLRKKVEVWQGKNYLENFVQALIDTVIARNDGKPPKSIIIAGDGRYYNAEAIPIICRILAANGVKSILVPNNGGIMTTPAVSAAIRADADCLGAIVLTASHNPGGPGKDFGIKYNLDCGQPAGEDFTDELYERSLSIQSFKTLGQSDIPEIDIVGPAGTTFDLSADSKVMLIDPYSEYVDVLKTCFNFDRLAQFLSERPDFSVLFDGMHGAGGPFARKVLIEELGVSESCLLRCNPLPDFGKGHPDPNLTYASALVKRMGLLPDGNADSNVDLLTLPTLGIANDGDGDRNMIAGAGCFVSPSDSLAIICDNWESIPHFSKAGGPKGVARSMPSSGALDVVAEALGIACFVTPTGWKFFGNLMSSKELFGKKDYSPFLCGEESFGTGSDHIREKDGLWAALAWMSILMEANANRGSSESLVTVRDIVEKHWAKYGRHFYCRYDYEGVDSDAANKVMDLIRGKLVDCDTSKYDDSFIKLVHAYEFSYTDPVDGSIASKQGLVLSFQYANGDDARAVFRLSGTGSAGATIRMYLEKFEPDSKKHGESAPSALKSLAQRALEIVKLEELTGRSSPTVIT